MISIGKSLAYLRESVTYLNGHPRVQWVVVVIGVVISDHVDVDADICIEGTVDGPFPHGAPREAALTDPLARNNAFTSSLSGPALDLDRLVLLPLPAHQYRCSPLFPTLLPMFPLQLPLLLASIPRGARITFP